MSGVTFHGLENWQKHLFEHLGWMILAKKNNMPHKAMVYGESINNFLAKADMYLKENSDLMKNQRNDIMQLIQNVNVLKETWHKL